MEQKDKLKKYYQGYEYHVNVRFSDMDSYGIVHHGSYFYYFEEARCEFSREMLDITYDILNGKLVQFPVLEAECTYRNAINYDSRNLIIKLDFYIEDEFKLVFFYELLDEKRKVCARARTRHGIVLDGKICVELPDFLKRRLVYLEGIDMQ